MRKLFVLFIALICLPEAQSSDCNLRSRGTYATFAPNVLYYWNNGAYHQYTSGNHGQLYYYQNGHYYAYHAKETVVLVPKAIQVEVSHSRDHYYSIDSYAQQNLLADAIVGRLLRLQNDNSNTDSKPKSTDVKTKDPVATPDNSEPIADENQDPAMLKVITDSCAKCHGPQSKHMRLVTKDGKLAKISYGDAWECFGLVNSGEMPKGGKSLTDDQVKLFYARAKSIPRK
jgi:hypothetical protein